MDTYALPFLLTRQSKSQPNFSHEGPGRSSNCLGLAHPHLWSVNSSNTCQKKSEIEHEYIYAALVSDDFIHPNILTRD